MTKPQGNRRAAVHRESHSCSECEFRPTFMICAMRRSSLYFSEPASIHHKYLLLIKARALDGGELDGGIIVVLFAPAVRRTRANRCISMGVEQA